MGTQDLVVSVGDDGQTIACSGELDMTTGSLLEDALAKALEPPRPELHIDLSELSFMDSTGIRILVGAAKRCEEAGARLRLSLSRQTRRTLDVAGLTDRFSIVN